jgi:transcriptional antiterminator RfaH
VVLYCRTDLELNIELFRMKSVLPPFPESSADRVSELDNSRLSSGAWFCVRSHPKQEHIAAAQLRQEAGLEAFLPRIRYKRSTQTGTAWVTEALFQCYVFARFDLALDLRRVQHTRGVRTVVHFGDHWPAIPDSVIAELRELMADRELHTIEEYLRPGDPVELVGGAVHGLKAVITRLMPAKQRVAVLLELLGQQTLLELDRKQLVSAHQEESSAARFLFWQASAATV